MQADQHALTWRDWAAWAVVVVALACLALWFAPVWMGRPRPTTVGGWGRGVVGLVVMIAAAQWILGLRERTMRSRPMPSAVPPRRGHDQDRAT